MGQHTWFAKSKSLYLRQMELYEKIDSFDEGLISLSDKVVAQIQQEIDDIDDANEAEYHDLFRTGKRNADRTYTDDVIYSKEECFKWIETPENFVSFGFFGNDEAEAERREFALKHLNEFWDKYPDGVIYFG
jgi:hypothetical protein